MHEDEIGIALGPIIVNRQLAPDDAEGEPCTSPVLRASLEFYRSRRALQLESIATLHELLPLPRIDLPEVDQGDVIDVLARTIAEVNEATS